MKPRKFRKSGITIAITIHVATKVCGGGAGTSTVPSDEI